jgi:hypothetical protein
MEGHIHEEGREDCPLGNACVGRKKLISIHNAGLEPRMNGPSHGRKGMEFGEEGVMIDAVEAFFDVSIQDIFGLFVDARVDGCDRIMAGASWSEAVAIRFELGFPFGFEGELGHCLPCAVLDDGDAQRPFVLGVGFRNPDPADGLGLAG